MSEPTSPDEPTRELHPEEPTSAGAAAQPHDHSAEVTAALPPAPDATLVQTGREGAFDPPLPGGASQPAGHGDAVNWAPPPAPSVSSQPDASRQRSRFLVVLAAAVIFSLGAILGVAASNGFWLSDAATVSQVQPGDQSGGDSGTLPFGGDGSGSGGSESLPDVQSGSGGFPFGDGSGSGQDGSGGAGSQSDGPSASEVNAIAAEVNPALVTIAVSNSYSGSQGAATGIVLTSDGKVLTNNHVIDGATSISATDVGNGQTYEATVLGYDRSHDIALIQLKDASGLQTADIGDSSDVSVGEDVVAIGNAGGRGGTPSASGGVVTGLNESVVAVDPSSGETGRLSGLIASNADVQSGDSGGPFVNDSGEVIGVTSVGSGGYSRYASGGYAVPIETAMDIVSQIEDGDSSGTVHVGPTAFLGVQLSSDQTDSSDGFSRPATSSGAIVADVLSDSPAEDAGLSAGDVIVAIDGQTVDSARMLSTLIAEHEPGDRVEITWLEQSGSRQSGTAELAEGPAD